MKAILIFMSILLLAGSCTKPAEPAPEIVTCLSPGDIGWLKEKKKEFASCTCLVEFRSGIYLDQQVFEIRITDPLCNGINIVYKQDGTELLHSGNASAYQAYLDAVKDMQVFWKCNTQ